MGGLTKEYLIKRLGMFLLTVWLGMTLIFIIRAWRPVIPSRPWSAG